MKKNIMLIMSDQHSGNYTSMSDGMCDITPNLQAIADQGTFFPNTYCNAPLCVPSRMSFLSGLLPSQIDVLDNNAVLNSDIPTIAHKLSLEGYKTVLVGRMHFKGFDQHHGFDERYLGDITTQFWGQSRSDLGQYYSGFKASSAQSVVGEGQSPVLDFDQKVFLKAMALLDEVQEQPLFILVGFYAPHFPYVSNMKNQSFEPLTDQFLSLKNDIEAYRYLIQKTDIRSLSRINQIYQSMITQIDAYVGDLFTKFKEHQGLFIYTSDHGDQVGKRGIFGKKTLYEDSIRIPLVMQGVPITGNAVKEFSLLELHHLVVRFAKTGEIHLRDNPVRIQSIIDNPDENIWTEAVIKDRHKLEKIDDNYYLYNLENDPEETENLIEVDLTKSKELMQYLQSEISVKQILEKYQQMQDNHRLLIKHGKNRAIEFNYAVSVEDKYEVPEHLEFSGYEEDYYVTTTKCKN